MGCAASLIKTTLEVASKNEAEHRRHLREVFTRLVINAEKCLFGPSSNIFWDTGVTPLPHYVEAVLDFLRPTTVKELKAFLGLLNFYRHFWLCIAKVLRPLMDALHGDKSASEEVPCMVS